MLLGFILLGMLFGSDGILKIPFENYKLAEDICSAALIFIMFYGGFGTNWKTAHPVAVKSVCLSTLGVILTAFLFSQKNHNLNEITSQLKHRIYKKVIVTIQCNKIVGGKT